MLLGQSLNRPAPSLDSVATRIRFFLPEWDDLVDRDYNFLSDTHAPSRVSARESDVYVHELMPHPPFDGVLVSKSNVEIKAQDRIIAQGGIGAYLRVPSGMPVMGDCGAFQYIDAAEPPYTCEEILQYYDDLAFDYGITLDHVIPLNIGQASQADLFDAGIDPELSDRFELTIKNAARMRELAIERDASVELIACAQGWSPSTYREAIVRLSDLGYRYIALGGVARASDEVITAVLAEVGPIVAERGLQLHVLGVARLSLLDTYMAAGVVSCDSAASLMQAFKSARDNYHTRGQHYTAVRIPPTGPTPSPIVRRALQPIPPADQQAVLTRLQKLETAALAAVRSLQQGELSAEDTAQAIEAYHAELGGKRVPQSHYLPTLQDRPWEACGCAICDAVGVEVVMMRGNNRNRRRAFHNTHVFYQQFVERTAL
jgi:hypothetical protein